MTAPVDVVRAGAGGHTLPVRFASTGDESRRRRRPRAGLIRGAVAVLVAAVAIGTLQITANLGYDDARAGFDDALTSTGSTQTLVQEEVDALASAVEIADQLVQTDTGALASPAARETLASEAADAGGTIAPATDLIDRDLPVAETKPLPFWQLFAATGELTDQTRDLDELAADLDGASPAITATQTRLTEAGIALLSSAAAAAPAFEAAHPSARNDAVIALRDAAAVSSRTTVLDESAVGSLAAMQDAAVQVVSTEQQELAEKAGPLQGARLEIEAFARSLAPGVLLEFDWNPIVNGAGYNGSMGGLTRWWWDDPDRATIELSNSVAEQWPAERSRALVAHEVGHAISVKCEDMYDSSTQDSIEKWATAWAISMGFTDDANGVWAYGYPPQSYIDAAYGCR